MNKIAIAFLAATSLASFGCKKKGGGSGEAMEALKKYKTEICACKDHDVECGKKATDAYQKAVADMAAKGGGEKADMSKPDPEMEKLSTDVADCNKRVMMPDMGSAAAAPAGGSAAPMAGSGEGSAMGSGEGSAMGSGAAMGSGEGSAAPAAGSGSAK